MYTAARRRSIYFANCQKQIVSDDSLRYKASEFTSDQSVQEDILKRHVLSKLPKNIQDVFCLKYIDGFKQKEIAEYLRISESSVEKKLAKIRVYLKEIAAQLLSLGLWVFWWLP